MYIVTKNNPYYPSVEYCDTMEEAIRQREEWVNDHSEEAGDYKMQITIAEVITTTDVPVCY